MTDYEQGALDAERVGKNQPIPYLMMLLREAVVCLDLAECGLSDQSLEYNRGYLDKIKAML